MAVRKEPKRVCFVATYVRVSTNKQGDSGHSLSVQSEACERMAKAFFPDLEVLEYREVGSGMNARRPEYRRMMSHIGNGSIAAVVVMDLDRLCRNMSDFLRLLDLLERRGVGIISQGQGLNTSTPMGRMTALQLQALAEFESRLKSDRVKRGHAASRALRRKGPGLRPYGWRADEHGILYRDQGEQRGIDLAIARKQRGHSWREISEIMNEAGFQPVRASSWTGESIRGAVLAAMRRREEMAAAE